MKPARPADTRLPGRLFLCGVVFGHSLQMGPWQQSQKIVNGHLLGHSRFQGVQQRIIFDDVLVVGGEMADVV